MHTLKSFLNEMLNVFNLNVLWAVVWFLHLTFWLFLWNIDIFRQSPLKKKDWLSDAWTARCPGEVLRLLFAGSKQDGGAESLGLFALPWGGKLNHRDSWPKHSALWLQTLPMNNGLNGIRALRGLTGSPKETHTRGGERVPVGAKEGRVAPVPALGSLRGLVSGHVEAYVLKRKLVSNVISLCEKDTDQMFYSSVYY